MSKKNERNEKNETKSGKSRRDFLRNSVLGAAGLLVGLHLSKTDRVLARFASRHAGDFFGKARDVVPNDTDAAAFADVFNQVNGLVESNPTYKENMESIFNSIAQNSGPFSFIRPLTSLGLHTDTTNLLTASYLGALSSLRERAPDRNQIINILSDPSYVNQFIEPGFVNSLYTRANEEVSSNARYAGNNGSAVSQLERIAQTGGRRQPCAIPVLDQNGQYVGQVPCWVAVVVVVVVIAALVIKI